MALGKKSSAETFWHKIQAVYFHAVAFLAIVLMVIGAVMFINLALKTILNLEDPWARTIYLNAPKTPTAVESRIADQPYAERTFTLDRAKLCIETPEDLKCKLTEAEVAELEVKLEEVEYRLRYDKISDLINSVSFLLVGGVLFVVHRRRVYDKK